jgi:hypothetical protein
MMPFAISNVDGGNHQVVPKYRVHNPDTQSPLPFFSEEGKRGAKTTHSIKRRTINIKSQ